MRFGFGLGLGFGLGRRLRRRRRERNLRQRLSGFFRYWAWRVAIRVNVWLAGLPLVWLRFGMLLLGLAVGFYLLWLVWDGVSG